MDLGRLNFYHAILEASKTLTKKNLSKKSNTDREMLLNIAIINKEELETILLFLQAMVSLIWSDIFGKLTIKNLTYGWKRKMPNI